MDDSKKHRGTILVVDDVPDNLDLLSTILTYAGYSVRTTTSGAFALLVAQATPPDLILLDIRMPGMDGFAVCQQLKEDPLLSAIPIIFISALHEIDDKMKAFEAGGVDYLTKPFHDAEVLARVQTHLTLFRMQTRLEELVAERNADLFAKTLALQAEIEERKKVESERMELERELRQAQKMEAIGTLAGGIAHDFNNILSCIFGYTELALTDTDISPRLREYLEVVFDSARRAKDLVRQILTMSRRASQEVKPLQMLLIVKEALKLLRASLPASIVIEQDLDASEYVLADPTQIHQIVMNLCTNAFHAMREKGGVLTVSLRQQRFGPEDAPPPCLDFAAGDYVALVVRDTGHGMDEATREKIFDPYFTTKPAGEGTGLGLSVVAGIVKSCKGHIAVQSAPGSGTAFSVYLPVFLDHGEGLPLAEATTASAAPRSGTERIMLVDDEKNVIKVYQKILQRSDYAVSIFLNPREALAAFIQNPSGVDLVITDLIMPEFDGLELIKRLRAIRPGLPVILCTGESGELNQRRAEEAGVSRFILKPFTQQALLQAIRAVFDERTP